MEGHFRVFVVMGCVRDGWLTLEFCLYSHGGVGGNKWDFGEVNEGGSKC